MRTLEGFQKGVNLGGWLSQGPLDKKHLDTFIQEEDIRKIHKMGCDHLRLPVDYENIERDGVMLESGLGYIEACLNWCKEYGLNMVLDLHKTPGYIFDDPKYSSSFFGNKKLEARFLNLWGNLSLRFKDYEDMLMVEMLNEVTEFKYRDLWNNLAIRCIKVIRSNMPKVKILYGGVGYSAVSAVKFLLDPYDENIVYNVHCYEPILFTHQGAYWVEGMPSDFRISYPFTMEECMEVMDKVPQAKFLLNHHISKDFFMEIFKEPHDIAEKRNVPLYCGEYGVIDLADSSSTLNWIKDINACFKAYGIGRAIWNYKEKDFGIIGEHYSEIYDELIKYL